MRRRTEQIVDRVANRRREGYRIEIRTYFDHGGERWKLEVFAFAGQSAIWCVRETIAARDTEAEILECKRLFHAELECRLAELERSGVAAC